MECIDWGIRSRNDVTESQARMKFLKIAARNPMSMCVKMVTNATKKLLELREEREKTTRVDIRDL